jgi:hypothetical protein
MALSGEGSLAGRYLRVLLGVLLYRTSGRLERPTMLEPVPRRTPVSCDLIIAGFALLALLVAQWMLSTAIHGANYDGGDGKMAQAMILVALRFSKVFDVTTLSPIEGMGSQLLPLNVWGNPAHWPFAFLEAEVATDVSALVALAVFATACYLMARCFAMSIVPSAIAAELCIVLFAPAVMVLQLSTIFCISPDDAVVFAPHMVALGLLARLQPGSWRSFALTTAGIFALLLYSLYCDPLWTLVSGISWAVPFAVVTLSPLRRLPIVVRSAALGCCVGLLFLTGALEYLYTLSQYTARVEFAAVLDRPRIEAMASALFYSPNMKYFYLAWIPGWVLGLMTLRGRPRVLVATGAASFGVFLLYTVAYLVLQNVIWVVPVPMYVEQNLFPLFLIAAVAGYWGAIRAAAYSTRPLASIIAQSSTVFAIRPTCIAMIVMVALVPGAVACFALYRSTNYAELFHEPWPKQPELEQFFSDNIGLAVGRPFRGSIDFRSVDYDTQITMSSLWRRGIPTVDEYGQLMSPQAVYFLHKLVHEDVRGTVNYYVPWPDHPLPGAPAGATANYDRFETLWRVLQLFGARYVVGYGRVVAADTAGYPVISLPRRPLAGEPGLWQIYELPNPNVGNYSPTEVTTADTGDEILTSMLDPNFDFTKQVVLLAPIREPLQPARGMQLSVIRDGLHVSGHSDGTSLVVLPQQFTNCLRARDSRVRLVRADLMMTGVVFSGDLETDILFDYGIFSPACRSTDLGDIKRLRLVIDFPMTHLQGKRGLPDLQGSLARLREAGIAIGLLQQERPSVPPTSTENPNQPPSTEPAVTQQTMWGDLPKVATPGFALIGIQGLNAEDEPGELVVAGQRVLQLVAVPTEGRHYLATQSNSLDKNRVYRITAWVKATTGAKAQIEVRDGINARTGKPANYAIAVYDPSTRRVTSSSADLQGSGVEQGPDEWQKVWLDVATADGELVMSFGVLSGDRMLFKGDGRLGLTFGGMVVEPRS